MENQSIAPFEDKAIRKIWHEEELFFVVNDVIQMLTDTSDVKSYWKNLTRKDEALREGGGKIYTPLVVGTEGGKQKMNCANTEGILRIVMSITSPKVEPLKLWLAQVGKEHIEEIENPELGFERMRQLYKAKGYPDDWIALRGKSIGIRKELTDEWKNRGVKEDKEYSILTAEIAKATFGVSPKQHKELKGLAKQNLRDHMTNLELIFSALGEESTRLIAVKDDAQGFAQNQDAAMDGGRMAGKYLKELEQRTGQKVVTSDNFLSLKAEEEVQKLNENGGNTEGVLKS
jgi:DNA-damage-inducible protein D